MSYPNNVQGSTELVSMPVVPIYDSTRAAIKARRVRSSLYASGTWLQIEQGPNKYVSLRTELGWMVRL